MKTLCHFLQLSGGPVRKVYKTDIQPGRVKPIGRPDCSSLPFAYAVNHGRTGSATVLDQETVPLALGLGR